jgi:hypothetical protein
MKSFTTAMMFAVGLGCVALGAQSTSTQTAPQTGTQPAASAAGQVTLVGCLQRAGAGQATAGTTGATSATSAEGFVLANAMRGASAAAPGASTTPSTSISSASGVTAPDGSGQVAMNYTLEGPAADLTPHVGHRIEVTGTMAPRSTGTTGGAATGAGTATGTGAATPGAGAGTATGAGTAGAGATTAGAARGMSPRFTVTSVKMISADCGATR